MPAESAPTGLFHPDAVGTACGWLAAVLYAAALVGFTVRRRRGDLGPGAWLDHLPAALGVVANLAAILVEAAQLHRFPVSNLQESAVFLAFLLGCSYLIACRGVRSPAVEAPLLGLALGFLVVSFLLPEAAVSAAPPNSRWFVFHTLLSFLGVTALLAACVVSVLYLLADRQLKNRRPGPLLRLLPSLVACDRIALGLLELGFPLLSLGLLAGWMWSHEQATFRIGPKETLALVAWAIYAALLFARLVAGWRGRRAALLSVGAAAAALGAVLSIRL